MNINENKPTVWKSILCVFPCIAVFFLTRTLLALLISLAGFIISKIPILGNLLNFTFNVRGDNISTLAIITSVFVAYFITTFTQDKMTNDAPTRKLSRRILGVIIALYHLFAFIVNISEGGYYPTNIFCIIAALVFIFSNKDEY